jgi:selenocysteine-specific elongation factor
MPHVIGTAGHIDHGKTALVKALTGQDTDRLKEEKERGISIDLGFAYLDLPNGERAGIIDVPGHERFIRNMLAGAHGIDLVVFAVAADDGVMPQTEEHLDIIHLLGVRHAIFAVTKCDLATPERLRAVEEEIGILVAGTSVDHSPIRYCSATTGYGVEDLRLDIVNRLSQIATPSARGYFRLPVDRAFALQGHGLVVTGTALGGTVAVGDRVRRLPGGQLFRVRGLQVHGRPAERGTSGQRLALNLTRQDKASMVRGDVICDERLAEPSSRLDAFLEAASGSKVRIRSHQRVRVHLGTAARMARLVLLGRKDTLKAKHTAYCQLELAEPLLALRGDRFIVRDETGQRTIGGGSVVNPWARRHDRRETGLMPTLERLHRGRSEEAIESLVETALEFAVPVGTVSLFLNRREEDVRAEIEGLASIKCLRHDAEILCTTAAKWRRAEQTLVETLNEFHAAQPLAVGMDLEAARDRLAGFGDPVVFRLFIDQLNAARVLVRETSTLRLPQHAVIPGSHDIALIGQVEQMLGATPLSPPDLRQIEQGTGVARPKLLEVLKLMERNKTVVRVASDLYFLTSALEHVTRTLTEQLAAKADITPADFRTLFSTSRKYAIPLLEYLDRTGITLRVGDSRRLRETRRG